MLTANLLAICISCNLHLALPGQLLPLSLPCGRDVDRQQLLREQALCYIQHT
jgi:hypothetical protein